MTATPRESDIWGDCGPEADPAGADYAARSEAVDAVERATRDAAAASDRLAMLGQETWWRDHAGRVVAVDDMPFAYLSNLQRFLEKAAGDGRRPGDMMRFPLYRRISALLGDRRSAGAG